MLMARLVASRPTAHPVGLSPERSGQYKDVCVRAVVQRVKRAQVAVEGRIVGRIGRGLMVLLGVAAYDTQADAREIAGRVARMRILLTKPAR